MMRMRTERYKIQHTIYAVGQRLSPAATYSEERRQLEAELAFWRNFASAKAAHVLF